MAEKVLLETLGCAEELFGCSLSTLHTTLLLHFFYVRDNVPHSLTSEAKAKRYEEDFTMSLEKLYGGAGNGSVVYEDGFQMCMILWTQGALEEAVYCFDALGRSFHPLPEIALGMLILHYYSAIEYEVSGRGG